MRLHYPLNSNGAEDAGQLPWKDGVPSTGVQGSYPGHAIVTDVEAEILAAVDGGGLVRSGSDLTQLLQTIARGLWLGLFAGTATQLSAALPNNLVIPTLQAGLRVRGIAASNYPGGGGTLAIAGVGPNAAGVMTCPIVGPDGTSTPGAGAWTAGQFLTFEIDASGNARFSATNLAAALTARNIIGGNQRLYATPGAFGWLVPDGVSVAVFEAWGAGAGGGGANGTNAAGSGGGGGGYSFGVYAVTAGATVPLIVGAGGLGGVANPTSTSQTGGTGGTTSVAALLSATGGTGGLPGIGYISGVSGTNGTGSGGQINESGTSGGLGFVAGVYAGGIGGATPHGNGFGTFGSGATPGAAPYYGTGGSGCGGFNGAGGAGAPGRIKICW